MVKRGRYDIQNGGIFVWFRFLYTVLIGAFLLSCTESKIFQESSLPRTLEATFSNKIQNKNAIQCFYDGDEMRVLYKGKSYRKDVDNGSNNRCQTSRRIAAFYDGDEFYVFDVKDQLFRNQEVDNVSSFGMSTRGYISSLYDGDEWYVYDAVVSAFRRQEVNNVTNFAYDSGGRVAGLYDGDELYIYESKTSKFHRQEVDNVNPDSVGFEASSNMVGLYDGDEFYVFDFHESMFLRQEVDNVSQFYFAVRNRIAFLYDQDELYWACRGHFFRQEFTNNATLDFADPDLEGLTFFVSLDAYFISSETCKLTNF